MQKSEFESAAFGLNFYRADKTFLFLNKEEQQEFIIKNEVDIIKFNLDSSDKFAYKILYSNYENPYYLSTILNYFKDTKVNEFFDENKICDFIPATINDIENVKQIVAEVFKENALGYSNTSFYPNKIHAKTELVAMQNYIVDLIGKKDKGLFFLLDKSINTKVGFTTFSIENKITYCAYAGIFEAYRNSNYYDRFIVSIIDYNFKNKIDKIAFGVRADNIPLINKYNKFGCVISAIQNIFLVKIK